MAMVLHVPYTYFPDASGGTEVYVHALAKSLGAKGFPSFVAAPAAEPSAYEHDGVPVHRFKVDGRQNLELAYGVPDEVAAVSFGTIVEMLRPSIIHLHARTSAVSERLIDIGHTAGAVVVVTYHTPTVSCARGTMMLFGERPCDGRIERHRCTACTLNGLGLPRYLAHTAATKPALFTTRVAACAMNRPSLRIPTLISRSGALFQNFVAKADHVIAVCSWVKAVLERNGVPACKITLSRQGLAEASPDVGAPCELPTEERLRIAYFGRVDHAKGADILALALAKRPDANVTVDVYAIRPEGRQPEFELMQEYAGRDHRLRILPQLPHSQVMMAMRNYDLVAIPSRWLETGPLVAIEAMAARVPILGSKIGGIVEIVRDEVEGILIEPDDPDAWADVIARLASDRDTLLSLRANIQDHRSMNDSADDMARVYGRLLEGSHTIPLAEPG